MGAIRNDRHPCAAPDASTRTVARTDKSPPPCAHLPDQRCSFISGSRAVVQSVGPTSSPFTQPHLSRQTCRSTKRLTSTGTFCITMPRSVRHPLPPATTTQCSRLDRPRTESWSFMGETAARAASPADATYGSTAVAVIEQARRSSCRACAHRYHHR